MHLLTNQIAGPIYVSFSLSPKFHVPISNDVSNNTEARLVLILGKLLIKPFELTQD